MAKAHDTWTVLGNDPPSTVAENLWRVEGNLPHQGLRRVMTVVRRDDGALLIHNAIAMEDEQMAALEAWGKPAVMVVPNGMHRLDAGIFKQRYPDVRVLCPAGARDKVEQVVAVDGTLDELGEGWGETAALEHLDGVKQSEGLMRVTSPDGVTLVLNDAVFNLPHQPGFMGLIFKAFGSTGGPRVSRLFKMLAVKDRQAFGAHLERLAATPNLRRVIMSHGAMVDEAPGEFLMAARGCV